MVCQFNILGVVFIDSLYFYFRHLYEHICLRLCSFCSLNNQEIRFVNIVILLRKAFIIIIIISVIFQQNICFLNVETALPCAFPEILEILCGLIFYRFSFQHMFDIITNQRSFLSSIFNPEHSQKELFHLTSFALLFVDVNCMKTSSQVANSVFILKATYRRHYKYSHCGSSHCGQRVKNQTIILCDSKALSLQCISPR